MSEGDVTLTVATALAPAGGSAWARICGALYLDIASDEIPARLYHSLYQKQRFPETFRFFHESDSFPHSRYFSSGAQLGMMVGTVASFGYEGSLYQTSNSLDPFGEESTYGAKYRAEHLRFDEVSRTAAACEVTGVSLPSFADRGGREVPAFFELLNTFGIPYTTKRGQNVAFFDADAAKFATDGEIRAALAETLFLDPDAAKILTARGFGKEIGVKIADEPVGGLRLRDLGETENVTPAYADEGCVNRMAPVHLFAKENGTLYPLVLTDSRTVPLTECISSKGENLGAAMTLFENALGGRTVVFGMTVDGNDSQSLFNYARQRLLQKLLAAATDDLAFLRRSAKCNLIQNVAKPGAPGGLVGMLTLVNYSEDPLESPTLRLPRDFRAAKIEALAQNGSWQPLAVAETADGCVLPDALPPLAPLYLRFTKV